METGEVAVDAYSLAVVLSSSVGMAALGGWLVFGRRDENNLSAVQSQIRDLEEQTKSTQNRIDATNQHLNTPRIFIEAID
jgi:hypothetical protein